MEQCYERLEKAKNDLAQLEAKLETEKRKYDWAMVQIESTPVRERGQRYHRLIKFSDSAQMKIEIFAENHSHLVEQIKGHERRYLTLQAQIERKLRS